MPLQRSQCPVTATAVYSVGSVGVFGCAAAACPCSSCTISLLAFQMSRRPGHRNNVRHRFLVFEVFASSPGAPRRMIIVKSMQDIPHHLQFAAYVLHARIQESLLTPMLQAPTLGPPLAAFQQNPKRICGMFEAICFPARVQVFGRVH